MTACFSNCPIAIDPCASLSLAISGSNPAFDTNHKQHTPSPLVP
jgi:hypothetical protein